MRTIWSIGIFTESLQWFWLPAVQASRPMRSRQSYSVSANHCRAKLAEQSCPSYLHFVNRQLFKRAFSWDILLYQQSRQNAHLILHRKESLICCQIFPDSDVVRFFPPAAVALYWLRSADQLIQNLPASHPYYSLFCQFAVKVENRGGRSPTTPRDD